ncbi:Acetylxylan esterase [Lachnellula suecica]|uniref:Acetylxylan esterase n=1 Tax=Lachnellula suecica TaxID=602035 RepID=A0A8T9BUH7_9HELO|nr:Acetylxylan esterase [Lachnellula suecica]
MLLSILALVTVAAASPLPDVLLPRATCYDGVYVIGARGSEEAAGFGSVASVVSGVLSAISNSGSVALDYPASVVDPLYDDSVIDGINAMITLIENYVDSCGGEIVLVGFSQGANVVTDVLAGNSPPVVSAITVFGDPSFTDGQSFDAGTDTTSNGIFARSKGGASLALLNTYAAKLKSYCDTGDRYCASGDDADAHSQEVPTWGTAAVDFIASLSTSH